MPHPRWHTLRLVLLIGYLFFFGVFSLALSPVQGSFSARLESPYAIQPVLAQPNKKKLRPGDKLIVQAKSCKLSIVSQSGTKIVIRCKSSANPAPIAHAASTI